MLAKLSINPAKPTDGLAGRTENRRNYASERKIIINVSDDETEIKQNIRARMASKFSSIIMQYKCFVNGFRLCNTSQGLKVRKQNKFSKQLRKWPSTTFPCRW